MIRGIPMYELGQRVFDLQARTGGRIVARVHGDYGWEYQIEVAGVAYWAAGWHLMAL